MTTLTIGKLAQLVGINTVSIRYYEKKKLILPSARSSGGHRLYPEDVVHQLHFIQNAKAVGFTLEEIQELLNIQESKTGSSKQVRSRVLAKLEIVNKKLASLQKIQQSLERLVTSCDGKMPLYECPILKSLENKTNDLP